MQNPVAYFDGAYWGTWERNKRADKLSKGDGKMRCTCDNPALKIVPFRDEDTKQLFVDYGVCLRCGGMIILPPEPYECALRVCSDTRDNQK